MACAECNESSTSICKNVEGGIGKIKKNCDGGHWKEEDCFDGGHKASCLNDTECGKCINGYIKCSSKNPDQGLLCSNGGWQSQANLANLIINNYGCEAKSGTCSDMCKESEMGCPKTNYCK